MSQLSEFLQALESKVSSFVADIEANFQGHDALSEIASSAQDLLGVAQTVVNAVAPGSALGATLDAVSEVASVVGDAAAAVEPSSAPVANQNDAAS